MVSGDDLQAVLNRARELREQGFIAEVDLSGEDLSEKVVVKSRGQADD